MGKDCRSRSLNSSKGVRVGGYESIIRVRKGDTVLGLRVWGLGLYELLSILGIPRGHKGWT